MVDRNLVLGQAEKDQFVALMRAYEAFSQVRVPTLSVMSNHFRALRVDRYGTG